MDRLAFRLAVSDGFADAEARQCLESQRPSFFHIEPAGVPKEPGGSGQKLINIERRIQHLLLEPLSCNDFDAENCEHIT